MQKSAYLQSAGLTDIGMVRRANEDAFGTDPESGVFVVCDGMGGAAGGEVASRLTVEVFIEKYSAPCGQNGPRQRMQDAIAAANRRVFGCAANNSTLHGMGTTLVAAAVEHDHALVAHVGDSRCYLFHGCELRRQTKDHSLVDEQVRMGQLTEDEAERSPLRNVITRAIGTQRLVTPELTEIPLEPGDLLLLCSDGLTRELPDERLAELICDASARGEDVDRLCRNLVEAARAAGGRDNITCVLARVDEAPPEIS